MPFEHDILIYIQNNMRAGWLTPLMKFITSLGNTGWFFIVLALILVMIPKTRKYGWCMGFALILHLLVVNIALKNIVGRIRPYDLYTDIVPLVKKLSDYSFPSGHTSAAFAASLALYLAVPKEQKKWGILLLVLSLLIGLSRMYVGVHYPTDVLAGLITGLICGYLGVWMEGKTAAAISNRKKDKSANIRK